MSPITVTKQGAFSWTPEAQQAFEEAEHPFWNYQILTNHFEVECDACGTGIGAVLLQEGKPITYFSENLNQSRLNYSTYNKELYALVRALEH